MPVEDAVRAVDQTAIEGRQKLPYQRELKYTLVCAALYNLKPEEVIASWEATGITRALRLVTPKRGVFYDTYVELEKLRLDGADVDENPVFERGGAEEIHVEEAEVPLHENVIYEHLPPPVRRSTRTPSAPTERGPGRPKKPPTPPVPERQSIAFLFDRMKRQREETQQDNT